MTTTARRERRSCTTSTGWRRAAWSLSSRAAGARTCRASIRCPTPPSARDANSLGIGPMGLGGKTTLLGVRVASRPRVPASFFVTIAYMCWACRRRVLGGLGG
ncbi:MAG: fumarate hydratase [Kiritimatiellae bacterium]|nr:fumarate hydratase [Kiritimatiellia bacterium]